MPVDAEAAGKTIVENKNKPVELGNISETPGQRMKELVNLDAFKNSISNICQLWLGGIPTPPRRYEQWRSKIVQQEKISFIEPTASINLTTVGTTSAATTTTTTMTTTTTASQALLTIPSTSRSSLVNGTKSTPTESVRSNVHHAPLKLTRRQEPHALLQEIYKHTDDPLPE